MSIKYIKIQNLLDHSKKLKRLGALKKHEEFKYLIDLTSFLPITSSVSQRLWHINNNIFKIPKCAMCDNGTVWNKESGGSYRDTCSLKCSGKNPSRIKRIQETNLARYNSISPFGAEEIQAKAQKTIQTRYDVDNVSKLEWVKQKKINSTILHYNVKYPIQAEKIKDKIKQTNLERYDCENVFQNEDIKEQIKQANLKKYGFEYPTQSDTIKEQTKQTNLERYNVEYTFQSEGVKDKIKQTNLEKYDCENVFQNEDIKEQIKQTNLKKYGFEYPTQSTMVKEQTKQTNLERYNVDNHSQIHIHNDILQLLKSKEWLFEQHITQEKTLSQIANDLNVNGTTVANYHHNHGIETQNYLQSTGEKEVNNFIKSLKIQTITGSRNLIAPYEIDIYIPTNMIAIEYCGLYWHSEQGGKDKKYHQRKYELCKKQGIQLITVFEDEWFTRKEQVKSKLMSLLNIDNRETVYARKTSIINVQKSTKQSFYNKNHIQGTAHSSIDIGLLSNDSKELVACMSFIRRKDGIYELNRYATSSRVIGGFSKLLKHFKNTTSFSQIISFADLRWSNGNLYIKNKWQIDKIIAPDYSYSPDAKTRYHKFNYRRKNLPKLLTTFNPELSERENCDNGGILRIWDCGKIRFVMY